MSKNSADILSRVSHLSDGDKSNEIYDDWSEQYDKDLIGAFGYISPQIAAETLAAETVRRDLRVIDYGCGTGLVGQALNAEGFSHIDGIDISGGMLKQAGTKQVYNSLMLGDLTASIGLADCSYEAGLCIGSMGAGHVGAEHIEEMLRPIKSSGIFIIIMNGMYFETGGFERRFQQLEIDGYWKIKQLREFNYMSELDRPGWLLLATKL